MKVVNSRKIAVLGATGFIGGHLVSSLLSEGCNVVAFGRDFEKLKVRDDKLKLCNCDVYKKEDLIKLISEINDVDILYYLVWSGFPTTSEKSPIDDYSRNLRPLLEILPHLSGKRIVFSSSGGAVYGENLNNRPLKESDITKPISVYGMHKLLAENYITHYSQVYKYEYVIARISNPYGKKSVDKRGQGLVDVLIDNARNNRLTTIWGDGYIVRDYIKVSQVAKLLSLMRQSSVDSGIYNIASGNSMSIRELVQYLKDQYPNLNFCVEYNDTEARYFDVSQSLLDINKIMSIFKEEI